MSAKKCQRDAIILLFTSAIASAFAECRRELERLKCHWNQSLSDRLKVIYKNLKDFSVVMKRESWLMYLAKGGKPWIRRSDMLGTGWRLVDSPKGIILRVRTKKRTWLFQWTYWKRNENCIIVNLPPFSWY